MTEVQPTTPTGYAELLRDLKQKIRSAQLRAALTVNQELVLLYGRLSADLKISLSADEGLFSEESEVHAGFRRGVAGRVTCAAACCTNSVVPPLCAAG